MSSKVDSFGVVAPYYDELMRPVPYRMWSAYYLLLLSQQGVKPKKILDVCCGTGTMCHMLAAEGFEMTGFDLSVEMIEEARRKRKVGSRQRTEPRAEGILSQSADSEFDLLRHAGQIRYEVADAAEFELGDHFDAAYSFFDSLNNILEPARLQMAFEHVWEHLKPGGSWIFDVNTAYAFETKLFDQEDLKPSSTLKYHWTGTWNPESRIIEVDMKFWRDGEEFREIHRQRAYGHLEILDMLRKAGFIEVQTYHSYSLDPPRKKSDRLHYTCRKA